MRHRVAFASVTEGALALGDPKRRHVRLTSAHVEYRAAHVIDRLDMRMPWSGVTSLEVAAPTTRLAWPGRTMAAGAALLAIAGIETDPTTADFDIVVGSDEDETTLECHGFLGRGYPRSRATVLAALLDELAFDTALRATLNDPLRLLTVAATVARRGVDRPTARRALRAALAA